MRDCPLVQKVASVKDVGSCKCSSVTLGKPFPPRAFVWVLSLHETEQRSTQVALRYESYNNGFQSG